MEMKGRGGGLLRGRWRGKGRPKTAKDAAKSPNICPRSRSIALGCISLHDVRRIFTSRKVVPKLEERPVSRRRRLQYPAAPPRWAV